MTTPAEATRRVRPTLTLVAVCAGMVMVLFDATVTGPAMPTVQRQLHLSVNQLQWFFNAYMLTTAALMVPAGRLGDLYGRRRLFVVGICVYTVGAIGTGTAQSAAWIIGASVVQGVGGAFISTLSLSIIEASFPPDRRGRAIGIWTGVLGASLAVAPVLAGYLTQHVSWRFIFFLTVPIGALALWATLRGVGESRDLTAEGGFDFPGGILAALGVFLIAYAVMEGETWGWGSPLTLCVLFGGLAVLGAFWVVEHRVRFPLVPPDVLHNARLAGVDTLASLVQFGQIGFFFFLPLYLQNVEGYSPTKYGLAVLPLTIAAAVVSVVAGRLVDRVGSRLLVFGGLVATAVGFALLTGIGPDTSFASVVGPFTLLGIGFGMSIAPLTAAALASVPDERAGVASGLLNMARQLGGVLGVAVLGVVADERAKSVARSELAQQGVHASTAGLNAVTDVLTIPSASAQVLESTWHVSTAQAQQLAVTLFTDALSAVLWVSAGLFVLGSGAALWVLRRRAATDSAVPDDAGREGEALGGPQVAAGST